MNTSKKNIMNKIIPSKKLSYNCDGCLGILSIFGKMTPQKPFVAFPISSPLIKFAIRPKKIPIGETQAITSNKKKVEMFLALEKK